MRRNIKSRFLCRMIAVAAAACVAAASLAGCGDSGENLKRIDGAVENRQEEQPGQSEGSEPGNSAGKEPGSSGGSVPGDSAGKEQGNSAGDKGTGEDGEKGSAVITGTAENAAAENILEVETMFTDRDASGEYQESKSVQIALSGGTAKCDSAAVSVSGGTVTIRQEGTYILSGALEDGMILVEAADSAKVQLVLKGASVSNSQGAAVYVKSADKVFVTLAEGTVNSLKNGGSYTAIDDSNIDGVIFSKSDLTVNGKGSLEIRGEAGHGIVTKDDLKIMSGSLTVEAAGHGLSGKDSVRIAGGTVSITAGKDGIHSDHDKEEKGYVYLADGTLTITAGGDGISASGLMQIDGGSILVTAGGGSANRTVAKDENGDAVSTKGIKAAGNLTINSGSFVIDSQDDALHSNGSLTVNGGVCQIATGDDGLHGDETTTVAGGSLLITASYEGIEGKDVVISGGTVDIKATDDGINAAGGRDQSGYGGMFGGRGGFGGGSGDNSILISGGTVYVNAAGDGLDSNGTLTVSGGTVYVDGPTNSGNGALDFDGTGEITGGTVIALGAAGMAQNFTSAVDQGSIFLNTGNCQAGTEIALKDESGKTLCSYTSKKAFSCVVVSCPGLQQGGTYTLTVGGNDTSITLDSLIYGNGTGGFGGGRGGREDWGNRQDMPEGGFPDRGSRGEMPEGGFPEGGNMPEGGFPDKGNMPEMPEGGFPDKGNMPEGGFPDRGSKGKMPGGTTL